MRYYDGTAAAGGDGLAWETAWDTWSDMETYLNGGTDRTGYARNDTLTATVALTQAGTTLICDDGSFAISVAAGRGLTTSIAYNATSITLQGFDIFNCGSDGLFCAGYVNLVDMNIYNNAGYFCLRNGDGGIIDATSCDFYSNTSGMDTQGRKQATWTLVNVHDNGNQCYWVRGNSATGIDLDRCKFYNNNGHGFYFHGTWGSTMSAVDCEFRNNNNMGLHIYATTAPGVYVTRCLFVNNASWAIGETSQSQPIIATQCSFISQWRGLDFASTAGSSALRCNFINCTTALQLYNTVKTDTITDCIFQSCVYGPRITAVGSITANITYCAFYDNINDVSLLTKGAGCVTGDPTLVNIQYSTLDLRPKATSACIGVSSTSGTIGAEDYTATAAPAITSHVTGTVYTDTITLAGTAASGQYVDVVVGGVTYAAPVAANAWSITIPLSEGANAISCTARDEDIGSSSATAITVTASVPTAPTISTATGAVYTDTATIAGTIVASQGTINVEVLVGGVVVAGATPSGTDWTVDIPLSLGANVVTARAVNEVGTSSASTSKTITGTAPTAPSITGGNQTLYSLAATIPGTITGSQGVVTVKILRGGVEVGGAVPSGTNWTVVIPVVAGVNTITAVAVNALGDSVASASITVTASEPDAPVISTPTDAQTLYTDTVTLSGTVTTAQGTTHVNVYVGASCIAAALVVADAWTVEIPASAGSNTITVRAVNAVGEGAAA